MQSTYAQKCALVQKATDKTAAAVQDNSPQSEGLQRKADLANAAVQRAPTPPRPNNTGLPDDLKNGIESLSGYSLDNVRVHYNSPKPATVQALAYTQGTDIHVAPGQEHALPHEAWHVTQQMAGRVTPTTNIGGMPVNDNAALEHEADVMGEKAVQCMNIEQTKYKCEQFNNVLQCLSEEEKNRLNELISNIIKKLKSINSQEDGKINGTGVLNINRKYVGNPILDPTEPDAKTTFSYKMNRDHIIPFEGIADFLKSIYNNWEVYKNNQEMRNWIAAALETFFKNNFDSLTVELLTNLFDHINSNSRDLFQHEYIQKALLWMPGNIFLSWCKYGFWGQNSNLMCTSKERDEIPDEFDDEKVMDSMVGREDDAANGKLIDDYAERVIGKKLYKEYSDTFEKMKTPTPGEDTFKILTKIAKRKLTQTRKEEWKTGPNNNQEKGKKKYVSQYQGRIPDGFDIQDCGSYGNNSLLLSLGINGDFNEIRRRVIYYESEGREYDATGMTTFLAPETLFPVLCRMRLLYHQVWIYNAANGRWVHWNGCNLSFTDIPPRSSYQSAQIFLFYNGINHYQRLVPQNT